MLAATIFMLMVLHRRSLGLLAAAVFATTASLAADLRVGIIGLDTSHVVAFTELLNNPANKHHIEGAKVVAAFKAFSPDIPSSATRVEGYTKQLQDKYGVKLASSIEELCAEVDAVMIENVDGRPHLAEAREVFKAGKPVFIDKPVAGSLKDAITIFNLARESKVPCFTSSAYRYYDSMIELKKKDIGELKGAISYGPSELEPHHPDLFWYGIHPAEALYTVMGTGCESVVRVSTPDTDVVTGIWRGGKVGTLRGLRKASTPHKVILFGTKAVAEQQGDGDYVPLVREIVKFFQTGISPVPPEETIELFAFMEAADQSKREGGVPVKIADVLAKNRP
jgi:hypothetical protein